VQKGQGHKRQIIVQQQNNMDSETFTRFLVAAMNDDEGAKAFTKVLKPLVDEINGKMDKITIVVEKQQNQIMELQNEIESLKQLSKNKTNHQRVKTGEG
jgi:homospermidine synthase